MGKKKRYLALLAIVVAVALFAAVASRSASGNTKSGSANISGTLVVWNQFYVSALPDYMKAVDKITAAFEKAYPKVKVKMIGQANYDQVLQAAFAAHSGPDLITASAGATGVLRWSPGLITLNSKITPDMKKHISLWYVASQNYNPKKAIYGVPFGIQANVFYYNKSLFKKAGLSNPPSTFQDLLSDCQKLKAAGIQPIAGGDQGGFENQWYFDALFPGVASTADTVALGSGALPWTSDKVRSQFQRYKSLQDAGCFSSDRYAKPFLPDGIASFANGQGAIYLGLASGNAFYGNFNPTLGTQNVGLFEIPGINHANPNYLPVGSLATLAIPKFSKNPSAAWAYTKFFTGHIGAQTLYNIFGLMPNNDTVKIPKNAPPQLVQMLKDFRTRSTFLQPFTALPGQVGNELMTDVNSYLQNQMSLDDLVNTLQKTQKSS